MIRGILDRRDLVAAAEAYCSFASFHSQLSALESSYLSKLEEMAASLVLLYPSLSMEASRRALTKASLVLTVQHIPSTLPSILLSSLHTKNHLQLRQEALLCLNAYLFSSLEEKAAAMLFRQGILNCPLMPMPHARRTELSYEEHNSNCRASYASTSSTQAAPSELDSFALKCRFHRVDCVIQEADLAALLLSFTLDPPSISMAAIQMLRSLLRNASDSTVGKLAADVISFLSKMRLAEAPRSQTNIKRDLLQSTDFIQFLSQLASRSSRAALYIASELAPSDLQLTLDFVSSSYEEISCRLELYRVLFMEDSAFDSLIASLGPFLEQAKLSNPSSDMLLSQIFPSCPTLCLPDFLFLLESAAYGCTRKIIAGAHQAILDICASIIAAADCICISLSNKQDETELFACLRFVTSVYGNIEGIPLSNSSSASILGSHSSAYFPRGLCNALGKKSRPAVSHLQNGYLHQAFLCSWIREECVVLLMRLGLHFPVPTVFAKEVKIGRVSRGLFHWLEAQAQQMQLICALHCIQVHQPSELTTFCCSAVTRIIVPTLFRDVLHLLLHTVSSERGEDSSAGPRYFSANITEVTLSALSTRSHSSQAHTMSLPVSDYWAFQALLHMSSDKLSEWLELVVPLSSPSLSPAGALYYLSILCSEQYRKCWPSDENDDLRRMCFERYQRVNAHYLFQLSSDTELSEISSAFSSQARLEYFSSRKILYLSEQRSFASLKLDEEGIMDACEKVLASALTQELPQYIHALSLLPFLSSKLTGWRCRERIYRELAQLRLFYLLETDALWSHRSLFLNNNDSTATFRALLHCLYQVRCEEDRRLSIFRLSLIQLSLFCIRSSPNENKRPRFLFGEILDGLNQQENEKWRDSVLIILFVGLKIQSLQPGDQILDVLCTGDSCYDADIIRSQALSDAGTHRSLQVILHEALKVRDFSLRDGGGTSNDDDFSVEIVEDILFRLLNIS